MDYQKEKGQIRLTITNSLFLVYIMIAEKAKSLINPKFALELRKDL